MCKEIPLGFGTVHHFRHPLWGSLEYLPWIEESIIRETPQGFAPKWTLFSNAFYIPAPGYFMWKRKVCIEISYFHNILNIFNIHDEFWIVACAMNVSLWSLSPLGLGLWSERRCLDNSASQIVCLHLLKSNWERIKIGDQMARYYCPRPVKEFTHAQGIRHDWQACVYVCVCVAQMPCSVS